AHSAVGPEPYARGDRPLVQRPDETRRLNRRVLLVDDAAVIDRRLDLRSDTVARHNREGLLETARLRLGVAHDRIERPPGMRAEEAAHLAPVAVERFLFYHPAQVVQGLK